MQFRRNSQNSKLITGNTKSIYFRILIYSIHKKVNKTVKPPNGLRDFQNLEGSVADPLHVALLLTFNITCQLLN